MKKLWIGALVGAFALGFGAKLLVDKHNESLLHQAELDQLAQVSESVLFGEGGKPVAIFDQADPRTRIVYFGFTRCPDVCPTSLAMLAGALNQIDDETKQTLRPMFVSLDPERDAAEASAEYAQYFHPMIEGLSAPLEVTKPLAHKYGVIFRKTELEDSKLGYTLDHSSYFYFLSPDGTLIEKVPHTLTPAPIVEAIKRINAQG
ncbi:MULTISPECIES: SCO family protein [Vibrio]|jgi:protein SCO1/2|uniref:SCO family protein n=1 Tax=Vibrio mediterranei TaxID=689 RepID=A0A241T8Y8_9VIBR|nr:MULTISPECIES: SCO family protein [Vibrio]ASI91594.1 SCO family protein [Vibrio mediterranei]AYV23865.1 SCO family protein [Vibrio mediterranei]EDL54858.1 Sco1-related protein [Vibrio mediterranei AK1]KFA95389.1 photosynthetic protein synthase I [Vibrio sp. ER1A]MCF4173724.1 SCO family protein [Vibrio sp. McD22-P3]